MWMGRVSLALSNLFVLKSRYITWFASVVSFNLLKPDDIYIYMLYRSANLQTLHFKYLFNKYTY